jgi:hypothetical protein
MTQAVRHRHRAIGRVSIWTQWLIVAADVVLCPVFVLLTAWMIGWLLIRRLWPSPEVASGSAHCAGSVRWCSSAGVTRAAGPSLRQAKSDPAAISEPGGRQGAACRGRTCRRADRAAVDAGAAAAPRTHGRRVARVCQTGRSDYRDPPGAGRPVQ